MESRDTGHVTAAQRAAEARIWRVQVSALYEVIASTRNDADALVIKQIESEGGVICRQHGARLVVKHHPMQDIEAIKANAYRAGLARGMRQVIEDLNTLHWKDHWYAMQLKRIVNDRLADGKVAELDRIERESK